MQPMMNGVYFVVGPLSDEDGGGFIARIVEIPDCIGTGETAAEAMVDCQGAMLEAVDELRRLGRPIHPNVLNVVSALEYPRRAHA